MPHIDPNNPTLGHTDFDSDVTGDGVSTSNIGTSTTEPSAEFSPGEFDGPEPDLIYRVGEQFYVLYELPLERLGILYQKQYSHICRTRTIIYNSCYSVIGFTSSRV